jgi:cyclin T
MSGREFKLDRVAIATAMVMFHQFYAKHSFSEHDRFEVAMACILLAAKTEESPQKLNTIISECHKLKVRGMQAGRNSSTEQQPSKAMMLDPKGEEFMKLKERILLLERVILHTIGFELEIEHPHKFLQGQTSLLVSTQQIEYINPVVGEGKMMFQLMQL